jgi:hypothetical protein
MVLPKRQYKEVLMLVEITVKVNGQVVREHVEQVSGTLEDMEEKIDIMSRQVAGAALQASVDAVTPPRPLFRKREVNFATKDTKRGR